MTPVDKKGLPIAGLLMSASPKQLAADLHAFPIGCSFPKRDTAPVSSIRFITKLIDKRVCSHLA